MATDRKHITELHTEHREFVSKLNFYRDEVKALQARLEEVVQKNSKVEVTSKIEHFQNQFIRQLEVADELEHEIKLHEHKLAENVKDNPVASDHRLVDDHKSLREDMESYQKIFDELKGNLNRFLEEVM